MIKFAELGRELRSLSDWLLGVAMESATVSPERVPGVAGPCF